MVARPTYLQIIYKYECLYILLHYGYVYDKSHQWLPLNNVMKSIIKNNSSW